MATVPPSAEGAAIPQPSDPSTGPRVLWLARNLPVPLNSGDRIYTARLVEALGRAGAQVRFLGLANPETPDLGPDALDPVVMWETIPGGPASAALALVSRQPVVGVRFRTPAYRRRLADLLVSETFDAIVIDQYGLGWAIPLVDRLARGRPGIVHVAHDFETDVTREIAAAYRGAPLRRLALMANARRTAQAERRLARRSDLIVTLTEEDRALFAGAGARRSFLVLPPGYDGPRRAHRTITADVPRAVAIVGSYRWTAKQINLERFLAAADPILADAGIDLHIVGDVPDELRDAWAPKLRAGRFAGFVDDLAALLSRCRMGLVVEAVGGGFKLKVLDYVMTRTPVAALTSALPGQAPDVIAHMLRAETPADLARAIVAAIDDPDRLNAMQEGALAAVSERYDWDRNGRLLADAIAEMVNARA